MKKCLLIAAVLLFANLTYAEVLQKVEKQILGDNNGSEICLYTLTNKDGNVLKLTNYGARIVYIEVPDKDGNKDNVTTGGQTLQAIIRGDAYGGASIGRFANRIANGKFTLDGTEYTLAINNRPNTLHGGRNGWHAKAWESEIVEVGAPSVKFSYISPDMEEGFPGTVKIAVTYTWTDDNEIVIDYLASTDKKTVINVTNHAYFNLLGAGKGYIFDHVLQLNASKYTPLNSSQIPTGEIASVEGTPFDFTEPHPIGYKIGETFNGSAFQGYDHNYVIDEDAEVCATVYSPKTGRMMEVITTEPGLQFYSGSGGSAWKQLQQPQQAQQQPQQPAVGAPAWMRGGMMDMSSRSAFALETQHYPDSPNNSNFPTTVLNPGEEFKSKTIYRFSVKND